MGKKKLACCVGLGVLLIAGNAEASDINPMKQHHEAVKNIRQLSKGRWTS